MFAHTFYQAIRGTQREGSRRYHMVTFRGNLAEWSLDALGWLAAFLADGTARQGVSTQLMLTADRTGS